MCIPNDPEMCSVKLDTQDHFRIMKNVDFKIVNAIKPGRMNTKLSNFTLHHRLSCTQNPATITTPVCRSGWGKIDVIENELL